MVSIIANWPITEVEGHYPKLREPLHVHKGLFPMAEVSINDVVDLFGNILVQQMGIVRNDRFQIVVEHLRDFAEIDALQDHFSRPNSTDVMRVPALAGVAIHNGLCSCAKPDTCKGNPTD